MELPDNYILVFKDVKHARVRVSENEGIRLIIPPTFSEDDIRALLNKKQEWIDKNLNFFRGMSKIELQRNQILIFGNRYSYFYNSAHEHKVILDHEHRTIQAKRDLLHIPIQEKWLKGLAKYHFSERTKKLAEGFDLSYNKLYIRNQRKKWGNCSKGKNISLNWRLIKAPAYVIDYIIIHELVHIIIMNHSLKFWTMLKSLYPDYKDAIDWLDKYGNNL